MSFLFPSKLETRSVFLERGGQYTNSDEEDGYESPDIKRRGTSVDEFLKGSELGKPVSARRGAHGSATRVSGSAETAGPVRKVETVTVTVTVDWGSSDSTLPLHLWPHLGTITEV